MQFLKILVFRRGFINTNIGIYFGITTIFLLFIIFLSRILKKKVFHLILLKAWVTIT